MLQSTAVTILLLLLATGNGLYRLPLKRYQRSVQSLANRNGTKIPLRYVDEISVVAEIQVGYQKDVFYVDLDTGSSALILPSVNCKSCGNHTAYKCAEDSNFTVDVKYVVGKGTGRLCVDNITIGGLTVQNQHFVVMEQEDINLRSFDFDGVLGLGFSGFLLGRQNTSDYPHVPMLVAYYPTPLFKNIVKQELVSLNVFSFYYAREEIEGGEVIFGGIDTSRYTGNLSYADVIPKQSTWKVNLEGFQIGSYDVGMCDAKSVSPCSAAIDTGTAAIWMPLSYGIALLGNLYKYAPSLTVRTFQSSDDRRFIFQVKSQDVPNLEPIHIYIAGEKFTLQPSAYLTKIDDDLYLLKLMVSGLDHWTLGETFLRSMYTVFDVQNMRIGFAPAV